MADKLCVVMPVYNEQDAIGGVLEKWHAALESLGIDFEIRPYNDGSKDSSLEVMRKCARKPGCRISVRDKPNGGHGNTVLTGYREAATDGFDWVFQIDSDDEMGPEKFGELWERRNDFDFLVGIRDGRRQALPRKVVSFVSRLCVRVFYGRSVWDVNTPYRLMRVSAFKDFFSQIPPTTFAPNVILSGLAARFGLRCFETRVPQHDRTTGEVSIKKWKLFKAAVKSFWQTITFALTERSLMSWVIGAYAGLGIVLSVFFVLPLPRLLICSVIFVMGLIVRRFRNTQPLLKFCKVINDHPFVSMLVLFILYAVSSAILIHAANLTLPNIQVSDYGRLWSDSQMFAGGVFPQTKSWCTAIFFGTLALLSDNNLFVATCGTIALHLSTAVILYFIGKRLFDAFCGVILAAFFLLSPFLTLHVVNIATEHTYMFFLSAALLLSLESIKRYGRSASKDMMRTLALGCLLWCVVWSRGEGIIAWAVVPTWLVMNILVKYRKWRSVLWATLPLLLVFALGAFCALKVNMAMGQGPTVFCSNDNYWPRLFGANYEHGGRFFREAKSLIVDQMRSEGYVIENDSFAIGCSPEAIPYIRRQTASWWAEMSFMQKVRHVLTKQWTVWNTSIMPISGRNRCAGLIDALMNHLLPSLMALGSLLYFIYLFRNHNRIELQSITVLTLPLCLLVCNICILAVAEASGRYSTLFHLLWGVYVCSGIFRFRNGSRHGGTACGGAGRGGRDGA